MIFDTNVHLTISDKWYNNKNYYNKDLKKNFDKIFKQNKLKGYACVGISNLEKYDHELFIKKFKNKNVFLVPALNPLKKIETQLNLFQKYNCKAVKIHPRSINKKLSDINLDKIFFLCNKKKFNVFICTYFSDYPNNFYTSDPKYIFANAYKKYSDLKILLMHGGCERIMEFAELVRFSKNILLDLSLTIMKYRNSSIDNDIKFLFQNYDQKITLGSDYPEINYKEFIKRIKFFSRGLSKTKRDNIYFNNFLRFIK
jgi:hypothetical protein